jgi:glycosyltransferase involved in cell wall biosynthesis
MGSDGGDEPHRPGGDGLAPAVKLLYVIDSLGYGGAERSITDLLAVLADSGGDVGIVQLIERGALADELRADGRVRVRTLETSTRVSRVQELRSLLQGDRPDLVHTQLFEADLTGVPAARSLRIPVVSSMVNTAFGGDDRLQPGLRRSRVAAAHAAAIATAQLVSRHHAVSQSVAHVMSKRLLVAKRRIEVVPRGRSETRLGRRTEARCREVRTALGLAPDHRVVLAVGRHEWQKGYDVLLDAVDLLEVPDLRVLIAGREGLETPVLRAHPAVCGPSATVQLLGARDDIGDLMCAADLLVMPSRREGLPGTLIEALALELPIVSTSIGPVHEVVDGLTGATLVKPDSASELADALRATLVDRPSTSGYRARFEERYAMPAVARAMTALYESVIR